jgi:probable F420-dependent oxidoreductase
MKFDVTINPNSLSQVPALAQQIDTLGFDGLWSTETAHNAFLPLALAAEHSSRMQLGTAVAIAFPRSPMVVAQLAWDLAEQSGGRFILGLGTQIKAHITRRFSTTWDSPGPRLREYILSLRSIWNTFQNNAPLKFDGEFYKFSLMTPFFTPGPIRTPNIPIFIAGVNPYLCKLAGELCQGFHVHPFHTAHYLREVILPNVEQGLASAGRIRNAIELSCAIFVVTGANEQEIENTKSIIKAQIAFYGSTPTYHPVLALHGWDGIAEKLNAMSRQGQWAEMSEMITDDMLNEFAVIATHDQLAAKVRERYEGLLDRVGYYFPYEVDTHIGLWQDAIKVLSDK